jgi:xylulokinase
MTRSTAPGRSALGPALLGIDLGTSSVKAVVTDVDGAMIGHAVGSYEVLTPRPGWSESDPQEWLSSTAAAVRAAVAEAGAKPVAMGFSGQMHGLVPTGAAGRPTRNAMLWSDARAVQQLMAYRRLSDRIRARLANPLSPGMAGPMLAWLAVHEPDAYGAARWALQPKDWLRAQLTGRFVTEPSDASATLLYDIAGDGWDADVVDALGLDPARLAPVLPSAAHAAGELTSEGARLLDLRAGIPVAAGAADAAAAALGSGLVHPSTVQLTIGTGAQVVRPVTTLPTELPTRPVTHLYRAATDKGWYAMGAGLNGGSTLLWVCRTMHASWQELYATAAGEPRRDDPYFMPHLHGERTPYLDPGMRGAWTGLAPHHDREHLLRAALEGVAFAVRDALEATLTPENPMPHLRLAGGGTTDPEWRQMLADVLGHPMSAVDVSAASGLGAASLAARAANVIDQATALAQRTASAALVAEPRQDRFEIYHERYRSFRKMTRAIQRGVDCSLDV